MQNTRQGPRLGHRRHPSLNAIGNAQSIPTSIFGQSQTIASKIATTFSEASVGIQTSSLIALGLILLVITLALNVIARTLVAQAAGGAVGAD